MKYELLIKNEFWNDLYEELEHAQNRVYMQFMTFEGDTTGLKLAKKLTELRTSGVEVKVLIDRFTDYFVSDKYYKYKCVQEEVIQTSRMIKEMNGNGIDVRRTRPYGFMKVFFFARNHKKIIVIDDICYLGGINISDHNFMWDDFMVKITDEDLVNAVASDYLCNYSGKERDFQYKNIITNTHLANTFYDLIDNAQEEIIISSPYILDLSLVKILREKKVRKLLLTLKRNNYSAVNLMSDYLYKSLTRDGTKVYQYTSFSHAKFMIVDRKKVLIGSSNFGLESFLNRQEIGIVIEDKEFVDEFISKMFSENKAFLELYQPSEKRYVSQKIMIHIVYVLLVMYSKTFVKLVKPIG